ncbi:MAG: hypothetical protein ACKO8L_03405, partial [Flavobacterium sp.]
AHTRCNKDIIRKLHFVKTFYMIRSVKISGNISRNIDLSKNQLNDIIDLLIDLEVESLTIDGKSTPQTSHFASLVDKWSSIKV